VKVGVGQRLDVSRGRLTDPGDLASPTVPYPCPCVGRSRKHHDSYHKDEVIALHTIAIILRFSGGEIALILVIDFYYLILGVPLRELDCAAAGVDLG
jgi:hypothetical protein